MLISCIKLCPSCGKSLSENRTHSETYQTLRQIDLIPLCDSCLEFPDSMDMERIIGEVFGLEINDLEKQRLLVALTHNKTDRYVNPSPVIIGLIFTELTSSGGKVLAGLRSHAMKQYPSTWALVSGSMEVKNGGWRENLKVEATEKVCADLLVQRQKLVHPFTFDSPANGRLILNVAVVRPEAIVLNDFVHNKEIVNRVEIEFSESVRPTFGIAVHNKFFDDFCQYEFGWEPRH